MERCPLADSERAVSVDEIWGLVQQPEARGRGSPSVDTMEVICAILMLCQGRTSAKVKQVFHIFDGHDKRERS